MEPSLVHIPDRSVVQDQGGMDYTIDRAEPVFGLTDSGRHRFEVCAVGCDVQSFAPESFDGLELLLFCVIQRCTPNQNQLGLLCFREPLTDFKSNPASPAQDQIHTLRTDWQGFSRR